MLLQKLEFDGDSEYSKSLEGRIGDWGERQQIQAWQFNETASMHHTLQAVNADPDKWENYDPPRFLSHAERIELQREAETDGDDEEIDDF